MVIVFNEFFTLNLLQNKFSVSKVVLLKAVYFYYFLKSLIY